MSAVVAYVFALFALPPATPSAPAIPSPAQVERAAPAAPAGGSARVGLAAAPNRPEIAVPDESRANLVPARDASLPAWKRTPATAAPAGSTPPPAAGAPADDFFATLRASVRGNRLAPDVAAGLLVASAIENERVGHHDLAREDLALALERDPRHAEGLWVRAGHRYAAGDHAGALADCDAVLAARPAHPAARHARAAVLLECGRPADAHREWTALLRERPGHADAYRARAEAALALGQYQDADLDSEIAVELAPAEPRHRLVRMRVCAALGRLDEVFAHYEGCHRAAAPAGGDAAGLRLYVEAFAQMVYSCRAGLADADAVRGLDWMVQACPAYNPPRLMLAAEFLRAGRADLAGQLAADALERDPASARGHHLRGQARVALGEPGAAGDFEAAHCLDPDDPDARADLATHYRAAGRPDEARGLVAAGVLRHPDNARLHQMRADDALGCDGDPAAAERHATYALWLTRTPAAIAAARLTRGLARLAQGDAAGAGDLAAVAAPPEAIPGEPPA